MDLGDFNEVPIDELQGRWIAVDTETTGIHPWGKHGARPFAFSFCDGEGNVAYARGDVDPRNRTVSIPDTLRDAMSRVLGDRRRVKIMHNARFDLRMCHHSALAVSGPVHDTMVMAHVATGGAELSYGLKHLCKRLLGISDVDQSDLRESVIKARREAKKMGWPRGEIEAEYWMGDPELCKRYAVTDAVRTQALFQVLRKQIAEDQDMRAVYEREMKLFWVLWRMENRGVRVFPERIEELKKEYTAEMGKWESVVRAEVGREDFNFRSRQQLAVELFERRGHKYELTAKGNYKLDAEKLHELSVKGDRLAHAVAEWYVADGVRRKYLDVFDRLKTRERSANGGGAWVLHPSIRQVGAVTGRMSCGEPNLLTVSSETTSKVLTDVKPRPRYAFGPREGCVWLAPDYSQMEVVMFAFLSRDPLMTRLVLAGEDFHSGISQSLFGKRKDYSENAKSYRKRSKAIMFCKLYGGGIGKIASLIPCEYDEAEDFVKRWEEGLPHAMGFMDKLIHEVRKEGKLKNPLGRTYYFPDPNMAYKAVNYLVQGTGSDILKNSLVRIDRMFRSRWKRCSILLPIHDEVVVEVPRDLVTVELKRGLVECLQGDHLELGWPMKLPVSMKVIEKSWNVEREEPVDA